MSVLLRRFAPILIFAALVALCAVALTRGALPSGLPGSTLEAGPAAGAQPGAADRQVALPTYFGSLEAARTRTITPGVGGEVLDVLVEVGDLVEEGQELLRLSAAELEWAVQRAEIGLELARVALLELSEQSSETELAVAEANLELARADLAKLEAGGATQEEMAATRASAEAAWARYREIQRGPSEARLQQLQASLERAQLAVTQAQRAYNDVAWKDDIGRTPQAANLQRVTIDLNIAQASYNEATLPPRTSEVQGALAAAQRAQHNLNELERGVSALDIAVGRARVKAAEAAVERIRELSQSQLSAELRVSQALIVLEEAQQRMDRASVRAPITGIVLSLDVGEGEVISGSHHVALVGEAATLELVVGIPQDKVLSMAVGDPVRIARFGSEEIAVLSTISKISPISLPGKGNSTFPVTIRLPEEGTARFSPGIFVSATFE